MTEPRPATLAATVIPLRDGPDGLEVLMVHRNSQRGMFAGFWVFPGGQVDTADHDAADHGLDADLEIAAARVAAVREAHEEAGLRLSLADLVPLSHWMPPARDEKRFSTWFFLATAQDAVVAIDGTEIHDHDWITPANAMARFRAGEIKLAPPTAVTLTQLRQTTAVNAITEFAAVPTIPLFHSLMKGKTDRGVVLVWQGDVAYDDGDLAKPGPRNRVEYGADGVFEWEHDLAGS
jgi:8-oxo-dGTP pyrophosphatase MutT (NUDIX family)